MPWNMSNPLYRWKMKQGKLNKSVKRKTSQRKVIQMVRRRKRSSPRRRSRARRYFGRVRGYFRRRDKRMPLSVGIGLATSFMAGAGGYASPIAAIQAQDYGGALGSFVRNWTGIQGLDGKGNPITIDIAGLINPFSNEAPALKATLISGIVMKATKKLIHVDPISKVPILNKYVKFS